MKEFRMSMDASVCISVLAETEEEAKKLTQQWIDQQEDGISFESELEEADVIVLGGRGLDALICFSDSGFGGENEDPNICVLDVVDLERPPSPGASG